jgi:hypothetical protein
MSYTSLPSSPCTARSCNRAAPLPPLLRSFTPHLMPMTRGMEVACYVRMAQGASVADLRKCLEAS